MITSVAICIAPVMPGRVDEALHQLLDHRRVRPRLAQLNSTARFAGSSRPSAITAITPTTMNEATTQPWQGRTCRGAVQARELPARRERHRHQRRHDQQHLRHQPRRRARSAPGSTAAMIGPSTRPGTGRSPSRARRRRRGRTSAPRASCRRSRRSGTRARPPTIGRPAAARSGGRPRWRLWSGNAGRERDVRHEATITERPHARHVSAGA